MILSPDKLNLEPIITLAIDRENDHNLNCLDELIGYVHELTASYPAPYTLFVSGGIDSQLMLYAWKLSGVPFQAVRINYMGMNSHDANETIQFCKQNDIELSTLPFDLIHFLENDLDHYAMTYKCASPQICTHMAFSKLIPNGTKVFSGNLVMPNSIQIDNTIYGLQRYATISGESIIPFFLTQSPRVARASVAAKVMYVRPQTPYDQKCTLYRFLGVPIIPQKDKMTGFEIVKAYYDQFGHRVTSKMKLEYSKFASKRTFDQLFRNKYLAILNNHYHPTLVHTSL